MICPIYFGLIRLIVYLQQKANCFTPPYISLYQATCMWISDIAYFIYHVVCLPLSVISKSHFNLILPMWRHNCVHILIKDHGWNVLITTQKASGKQKKLQPRGALYFAKVGRVTQRINSGRLEGLGVSKTIQEDIIKCMCDNDLYFCSWVISSGTVQKCGGKVTKD